MKTEQDIVYEKHCCKCSLRHTPNCYYDKCSLEKYTEWLKEARKIFINISMSKQNLQQE